jgi:hypothetical protein
MPSHISWLQPDKLICLQMMDFVSHDDIVAHMRAIEVLVEKSAPATVHLIVDFTDIAYLPTNLQFLADVSRPLANIPNFGHLVVFGTKSPLMRTLTSIVAQLVRFRFKSVRTLDEALGYLNTVDPELEVVA